MPPAKKAAKKQVDPQHHELKDLRRAYEHLGRIEILQTAGGQSNTDVSTLAKLAQKELKAGHAKDAADLLRAAEHLSFAAMGASAPPSADLSPKLGEAISKEFDHLLEKASEHWDHEAERDRHPEVEALFRSSVEAARKARKHGAHRRALELARGAEALAHVKKHGPDKLSAGKVPLKLATS